MKGTVESYMSSCTLCPRACKVDRNHGQIGACGQSAEIMVARAALHKWEEPCISGIKGSGAIFFCGCGLGCVFCQNYDISGGGLGKVISRERLSEIFLELQEAGANNINLVTGCQFVPHIVWALERAKRQGFRLPVVYNSGGYESVETLCLLEGLVDVYLPDLKFVLPQRSKRYCHAPDYFERASRALEEMVRQAGAPEFTDEATGRERLDVEAYQRRSAQGESLLMIKGVLVRHLMLPGGLVDSKKAVKYLLDTYGDSIFVSIMSQYTPCPGGAGFPELRRRVGRKEYAALLDYAIEQGLENGFMQERDVARESFIPAFDGEGV